jgi:hypothetical protein
MNYIFIILTNEKTSAITRYTVKPVLRGYLWDKEKMGHMKFSMTGQEKGDLLIQVSTWAG